MHVGSCTQVALSGIEAILIGMGSRVADIAEREKKKPSSFMPHQMILRPCA